MKAWCVKCACVDYVDRLYRCLWCGHVTLAERAKHKIYPKPSYVTVPVLLKAHRLHAEGATIRQAAEQIHGQTGYSWVRDLELVLPKAWAALGLPYRSAGDSQRIKYARGFKPKHWRTDVTIEAAVAAVQRHGNTLDAAIELGVHRKTVQNRIRAAGL